MYDPAQIMDLLEGIDNDLEVQSQEIGDKALAFFKGKRAFELELAKAYVQAQGSNQKERESKALEHVEALPVYDEYVQAEAGYNASKSIINILETRATICQSLLKIHAQEAKYGN